MVSANVLLLDNDESVRQHLQSVFSLLEHGRVESDVPVNWQHHLNDELKGVFAGPSVGADELRQIASELNQSQSSVPLFVFSAQEGRSAGSAGVLARLDYPPNYHQLITALHRAESYAQSRHPHSQAAAELSRALVGKSTPIRQVRRLIEQVADSDANVLVLGESGTGKEVVAKSLHYLSSRRGKPFVPVNCGAIPPDLLESELFGHEKGAFTGALTARQGRFEIAEGGTLFLDEIGDMPLPMQVKLLRVLQERTYERVGSNTTQRCDVRIIAATHRNLEESIAQGDFREDLYYRLNVFPIEMPALQQRLEDVPLLLNELVRRLQKLGRGNVSFTPNAMTSLTHYAWPGNVRELANLAERLVIMHPDGIVDYDDLPDRYRMEGIAVDSQIPMPTLPTPPEPPEVTTTAAQGLSVEGIDLKHYLAELERDFIEQSLELSDGVVAHAAKLLNMRRTTLVEKMRKYEIKRDE